MDQHTAQHTPRQYAPETPGGPGEAPPRGGGTEHRRSLPPSAAGPLLADREREQLDARLQAALNGFVDGPRHAVEEADAVFDALSARLAELLGERRVALRTAWDGESARAGTEELRTVLLGYRDLTARLLAI
ncbi:hypothetical protein LE181_26800 [Streptomyces sp. SCA3-4]|uniref:hypothetical protein n=1 Tax=Streptomyces sichuanensis TaxID=2871810 RepID=UPI001CE30719|nr:hypothetical protein [Streptomyces sichuanensis]MCA6095758.1 hypothetical protein [Streptomyces sichuanensis]